ncbi:MAG: toprim domain-containing protein [Alphaproteobacteria bacterium]|nr:toprim domain-containing protein [Alphaproteobacteria bacterium]MCW5742534.1 toprim domain-containing protein [Alphaproteobacteria bacterium]
MNARAESLARALGGRKTGNTWTARCPAHEDGTPSLSIAQAGERVLVHCHAGCGQDRLLDVLRRRGLWCAGKRPRGWHPPPPRAKSPPREAGYALKLWHEARPARGSLVETWLASRGLSLPQGATLRFHPGLKHRDTNTWWPAMVALVQGGLDGRPQAIHRTFLARDGRAKAPVPGPRLALGPCRGGAARLSEAGPTLMIGEGIETCLAAMQATGLPAWSALSTGFMTLLELPPEVREVIVLADGDDAGEAAALSAARRWLREGRTARIARPPRGLDFNDLLLSPSPREGGEKVPSASEADEGLLAQRPASSSSKRREAPHPPFGHLLPAFAGRREE